MANHPYNNHREQQVAHRRVATILGGTPSGGSKQASGHAFSKITSKSAAARDGEITGKNSSNKYARGGKVKGKGDTTINIVVPGGGAKPPMPPPMPPPGLGAGPPPGLPPGGPPMPPPGMGPGGPPGMPMRAAGGRIGSSGNAGEKARITASAARAKKNSYFRGGAATGVGREEKASHAKRK